MISYLANQATLPLMERVVEQKINLAPVPGSPLALLVEASLNPEVALVTEQCSEPGKVEIAIVSDFTQLNTQSNGQLDGEPSIHCHELKSITDTVANSVRITMDTARNKVNPVVTTIIAEIQREFKENVYNYGLNVELSFAGELPLLKNDEFLKMVSNNRQAGTIREVPSLNCFASLSRERLPEFLKTNVDSVDADIANWFNSVGNDNLGYVFSIIFQRNGDSSSNVYNYIREDLDFAIATYLLARNFINDETILEHVDNISLSEFRAKLTVVMASAATIISATKERFNATKKRDVLVHTYPSRNSSVMNTGKNVEILRVTLHKDKFDEFIERGGHVDMIYGNILVQDRSYTIDDILANGKETQRRWESHALALRNKADSRKFEVFKRAILSSLSQWVRDNDDYVFGLDPIITEARQLVGKITYGDMSNIYDTVLTIVDKVLFSNSDAVKFLRIMNKYSVDQPELDMRHIATLAAYEYTSLWVSSMIIAEK